MHHSFISGRLVPVRFEQASPKLLEAAAKRVLAVSRESVLAHYEQPFPVAFHARFRFTGLRPKKGTVFERQGIALLAKGKLAKSTAFTWGQEANAEAISRVQEAGLGDSAKGAAYAFGKLVSAREATLALSELELWAMSRAYAWESMEALEGELASRWVLPPDYVVLLDSALYGAKSELKQLLKAKKNGEQYAAKSEFIPRAIVESGDVPFIESYYQSSIKVLFNSLYGTQAQDPYKPAYDSELNLAKTMPSFGPAERSRAKSLYTYGLRIAGGSRLHLVLAMELVEQALGSSVAITGGDTDSLKIALHKQSPSTVLAVLQSPLSTPHANTVQAHSTEETP